MRNHQVCKYRGSAFPRCGTLLLSLPIFTTLLNSLCWNLGWACDLFYSVCKASYWLSPRRPSSFCFCTLRDPELPNKTSCYLAGGTTWSCFETTPHARSTASPGTQLSLAPGDIAPGDWPPARLTTTSPLSLFQAAESGANKVVVVSLPQHHFPGSQLAIIS